MFKNSISQYKALHVGYIIDYVLVSLYVGLAFPDSFHIAKGSTESTANIQMKIFNTIGSAVCREFTLTRFSTS